MTPTPFSLRQMLLPVGVVLALAFVLGRTSAPGPDARPLQPDKAHQAAARLFACPMNDVPPLPRAGACPVCGMELVPMPEAQAGEGPPRLKLTDEQLRRAGIALASARRRPLTASIRLWGDTGIWDPLALQAGASPWAAPGSVWVVLRVPEADVAWLHPGQPLEVSVDALPGRRFVARLMDHDWLLNPADRTLRAYALLQDPDPRILANMTVQAELRMDLDEAGPRGWDMPATRPPLAIPEAAPLITGRRAIVFVRAADGGFELREVRLGLRAEGHYVVLAGLSEGEEIAANGSFKLDSEQQIRNQPSLMNSATRANPGEAPR